MKKETLAQSLSCEFCEISKNTSTFQVNLNDYLSHSRLRTITLCNLLKIKNTEQDEWI